MVVSFDYDENAVDKVSYHIGEETQRFYLTIKPKKGYDPLDVKDVQYDYTGSHADVVITFGVVSFEELEQLFAGYEEMYQKAMVVAFCPTEWEGPTHCVVAENDGEHSALAAHIIQKLELHVSMDAASALTAGIQVGTNSLQNEYVSPEFYEIMAYLLRQGADKKPVGEYRVLAQKNSRKKLKTVSLR